MNIDCLFEIDFAQKIKHREVVAGDTFLTRRVKEENRIISVLADGLGSGVKANVLSTLLASMAVRFTYDLKNVKSLTELIVKTLPVCSVRKISYSTFTIIEIVNPNFVRVIEYDNPETLILRAGSFLDIERKEVMFEHPSLGTSKIRYFEFKMELGDRLICFSDGVTQSGIEGRQSPYGWGIDGVRQFIEDLVKKNAEISSLDLANEVVSQAWTNDGLSAGDDITCAVVYYRKPRKLLIVTGPPYNEEKDKYIAYKLNNYPGRRIICGGTTSNIIARELNREIYVDIKSRAIGLPPISYMEGVDLITEGIITLSKVCKRLEEGKPGFLVKNLNSKNPVDKIISMMLDSDIIEFLVGMRINEAHQNPELPLELDIRRNVVKRIRQILEEKFLKIVEVEYV